jgi:hypothetical protein
VSETSATRASAAGDLPAVVEVRTRARVEGRDAVVVRFENGARLRYVDREGGVREDWLPPDGDEPARTNDRASDGDGSAEALALRAVGAYLSFDGRARAAFVWGERNVATLLGESDISA